MHPHEPFLKRPGIERLWHKNLSLADFLRWLPLTGAAGFFRVGVSARRLYWRMKKRAATVKTISVGNLTVGGNGKTPFTIFLASRLQGRGLKVGIVSRGYKRTPRHADALLIADKGVL